MKGTTSPVDQHVGRRIRMRRLMLGLSQEALGGRIGVTFQQVQKYELGVNGVRASRLQRVADALDVPVSFFFDGQADREAPSSSLAADMATAFFSLPYASELAQHYTAMEHNADRRALVNVAGALAGRARVLSKAAE